MNTCHLFILTVPAALITCNHFHFFSASFVHQPFLCPITHIPQAGQAFLAFQRYKLGASSSLFTQNYTDPNEDAAARSEGMEYTGYPDDMEAPGSMHTNYDGSAGYQSQEY